MNVQQPDHSTFREWLHLEPDGELNAGQRSGLKQHLATCGSCRTERQELASLTRLLDESKISVSASFTEEVMGDLPVAGWETRSPKTWLAAMVVVLLLAVGASVLISGAGEEAMSAVPLTAATAVWELLSSTALAGAGLLAASWKGLGIAFQDVLGQSVWNILAFGALIVCLDLILFRLLFRRRPAEAKSENTSDS